MLTFQILDGGETFYRPLEDRPLLIGGGADADIRLTDPGVAARHARIETRGDECALTCVEGQTVLVNGMELRESILVLGDRVEIGDTALVLGRQVKRPATARDVLATSSAGRRRAPFDDRRPKKIKAMYAAVLLVGLVLAIGISMWADFEGQKHIPLNDRESIVDARRRGRFDSAREILDRLDNEWVRGDEGRSEVVREHRLLVEETAAEFERLHALYMAQVLTVSKADQLRSLRAVGEGVGRAQKEAARILAAGLTEFRIAAEAVAKAERGPGTVPGEGGVTEESPRTYPRPDWLDARLAEIQALMGKREHLRAWELARQTLPDVPAVHAEPLRDLLADIRVATRTEMKSLVDKAYGMRAAGRLAAGVKLLERESFRFPTEGELSMLYRVLGSLSAELGVPASARESVGIAAPSDIAKPSSGSDARTEKAADPVVTQRTAVGDVAQRETGRGTERNTAENTAGNTAEKDRGSRRPDEPRTGRLDTSLIAKTLGDVRDAEADGDLGKALALLDESIRNNAEYQPRLARFLKDKAADLKLIRAFVFAVTAGASSGGNSLAGVTVELADGAKARVRKIEGSRIHVTVKSEPRSVSWLELPIAAAERLADAVGVAPEARLGIGALGYYHDDADSAESFLARLLGSDTTLFGKVSVLVGRGRGELVDAEGYALVGGKFVSRRFLKVEKLAKKFGREIGRLAGRTPEQREGQLQELRDSREAGAEDALVMALKMQMEALVGKLARSNLRKTLAKLTAKRDALDRARKEARDLIFDRKAYFYPYKTPAVPEERASGYGRIQNEVDSRVTAVRRLWLDKAKFPIGKKVREDIEFLGWLESELSKSGELTDRALERVDWVRTIPPVAELTIRNFCRDAGERDLFVHYLKIEELNEVLSENLTMGEVEQVEVTNSYRLMFGHRPLAISTKLHAAAHGHAEEMARLNYFSHTSPTDGQKTPYQRMQNQGYRYGISENIAGNPSAAGAHDRWCHSSGHHRNLLNPGHTEIGVGNAGRLWVQNFGRGKDYLAEGAFPK